jgi:hypothetical protein
VQVEKGTQGVDSRVVNPRSKGVRSDATSVCSITATEPQWAWLNGVCPGHWLPAVEQGLLTGMHDAAHPGPNSIWRHGTVVSSP